MYRLVRLVPAGIAQNWPVRSVFKPIQNIDVSIPVYIPVQYIPASTASIGTVLITLVCLPIYIYIYITFRTKYKLLKNYEIWQFFLSKVCTEGEVLSPQLVTSIKNWNINKILLGTFDFSNPFALSWNHLIYYIKVALVGISG